MNQTPSKARHVVTAFVITLAVITYIDRVGIAVALPLIRDELKLSPIQMGWTLAAFAWAYAVFEIPGGWLGDKIGPRRVLMRIVIWWSFFTAATGWVWSPSSLIFTRALFGAGEAGAFPNLTRVLTTWLPVKDRERTQAWVWLATRLSGAFTPILVASLISAISWRRTFELFGVIGVIWAVLFYRWFRDAPSEHPSVNQAELALLPPAKDTAIAHGGVPWGVIFSNPHVWLLSIQYMCLAYGWWFYLNWLPTYLRDARGASSPSPDSLALPRASSSSRALPTRCRRCSCSGWPGSSTTSSCPRHGRARWTSAVATREPCRAP
jgi:ACS family glucarate transporter-like MFS transporter